ncbi:MAG: DUF2852 domain-containing protein [Rhodobacteraceae bacterium]|nr:DUF2852 domain-containing protein [Paracoccaceae bacterium]
MTTACSSIRPGWSPVTIGLMVLGFVAFWPLGLAMLAYILWGDHFHRMKNDVVSEWRSSPMRDAMHNMGGAAAPRTGNVAFDDYREKELKRLEEERAKLNKMRDEFDDFLRELRRAKDQDEFDRFMNARNAGSSGQA